MRPKFDRYVPLDLRRAFLQGFRQRMVNIAVTEAVADCADPKDNKFLALRETKPDGRPLYSYKCRDKDYAAIMALMRDWLNAKSSHRKDPCFEKIFCLYAAEAFRREHVDGVWTWDTVFRPLGIKQPEQTRIAEWVATGLSWWQREVLIDRKKQRRFLVTIACEGGLPLRLLREDTHLRRFFVALLEEYHRQGRAGPDAAELIASEQAIRFLPPSLCREVVFVRNK